MGVFAKSTVPKKDRQMIISCTVFDVGRLSNQTDTATIFYPPVSAQRPVVAQFERVGASLLPGPPIS